ncbi:hypothetical protein EVAR_5520_1 [Eumeta japonica]|uniref:Uncharacterized protein n=1 Tax=Eumeta variegata TaxID=151549 RepID=A0A4C1T949_EUMVA|nr:hypothetical protein EVAR_5520_1 [Eumeta japonica]
MQRMFVQIPRKILESIENRKRFRAFVTCRRPRTTDDGGDRRLENVCEVFEIRGSRVNLESGLLAHAPSPKSQRTVGWDRPRAVNRRRCTGRPLTRLADGRAPPARAPALSTRSSFTSRLRVRWTRIRLHCAQSGICRGDVKWSEDGRILDSSKVQTVDASIRV